MEIGKFKTEYNPLVTFIGTFLKPQEDDDSFIECGYKDEQIEKESLIESS